MSLPRGRRVFVLLCTLAALAAGPCAHGAEWVYTVQRGDNPWSLTERYLAGVKYWPRIQKLNQIDDPEHIPPGTRLRIPVEWLRRVAAIASIAAVQGEATVSGRRPRRPAEPGMKLRSGDVVRTRSNSNLTLAFADGSRVLVHAESELHLEELGGFENTDYYDTRLRLRQGRLENLITPLGSGPGRFEIATPAAVTAVRGTDFRVSAAAQATRAEVVSGGVDVATDAQRVDLDAGFGSVTELGQAPSPPVALLPAPDVSGLPARLERVPVAVTVPPLAGATGYRYQIAASDDFASILYDGRADSTRLRATDLADGEYVLRVRGIDAQGLEGLNADHRFVLDARPEPPLLTGPAPAAGVNEDRPQLSWGGRSGISRYRVQIARDEAFTDMLMDDAQIAASNATSTVDLVPGSYYWRVAAIDDIEGQGPFSDAQAFRRLPPAPALDEPAIDETQMTVRWRAGEAGEQFQFQFSASEDFAAPLIDTRIEEAQTVIERPDGGTYYMRVKTIDAEGHEGAFGTPQRIEVPRQPGKPWWLLLLLPIIVVAL